MNEYIIGIDIGGTNFRIGMINETGKLMNFQKLPTLQVIKSKNVIADIIEFIRHYSENINLQAISIGFPATLDRQRKRVLQAPNIKFMESLPVVSEISHALGVPVFAERDVTMALFYDVSKYKLPDEGIICGIYFGTGIGNAININGQPLLGKNGTAGELGHIPVDKSEIYCGCGKVGCMENLAGGKYLARIQKEYYPETPISEIFLAHGEDVLLREFVNRIAMTVSTEINILDPDYVLVGGGVPNMNAFPKDYLHERIIAHTRKPYPAENINIIYTDDESDKSVIGAAIYARKNLTKRIA